MQNKFLILLTLFILTLSVTRAQTTVSISDSIKMEDLLRKVESENSVKIFTDLNSDELVPAVPSNTKAIDHLRATLEGTGYHISQYNNFLYVFAIEIGTNMPLLAKQDTTDYSGQTGFINRLSAIDKANSENLIYEIGDRYAPSIPEKAIIKGKITDSKTGEPLIGVNVFTQNPYVGTTTDANGNYSLELPCSRVLLNLTGLNIKNSQRNLSIFGSGTFNIELIEEIIQLDEFTVYGGRIDNVKNLEIGMEKIRVEKIKNIPTALGEVDILRVLQSLPGVKTVGEASSGFNVRGGATDQNLILLNNGTIYNPNHLFGFFTAFSSDMINEAELYKSSIPTRYGGRISSVLDITSREANKTEFKGSAGLGLVTSKLNLEIPIVKEKSSLLLSGRTTYSDWILKQLPSKSGYNEGTAGFYDLGGNYSHDLGTGGQLNVYGYYSHDRFSFGVTDKYEYNNLNASANWKKIFDEKLIGNFSAGYDHYDYYNSENKDPYKAFNLTFDINQVFAKADFTYDIAPHKLDFGIKSIFYSNNAGTYSPLHSESFIQKDVLQRDKALESAIYAGDTWTITDKFSLAAGIRYSMFNALGPRKYYNYSAGLLPSEVSITDTVNVGNKIYKTYHGPEFRVSARYIIQPNLSVKAGFNSMRQYIHKLSNTVIMSPTDTWKLSDANILPQTGWQAAGGVFFNSSDRIWETSLEAYYKKMNDYLDYRSGATILMNHHIETDVLSTHGKAYGVELMVKKSIGKLNGWFSYSYSRTFLQQNDKRLAAPVNGGKWYSTEYDKPHELKMVGNYKFSQRYSLSVNMDYSTGRPITIPVGMYFDESTNSIQLFYSDRNSYRIPDYFRTDISFNVEPSHHLTLLTHHSISFGVYNVTGRKNVYSIYFLSENGKINGYQLSIFGTAIPFVTYNIKF
ncbi:MAG: TonB-dependent receptor [Dysgonamonadaceae bacterium]|jgi:hypothetical protein|nr:TonB-dependent receptor [Dysgonamonadaceae bacterium]